MAILQEKTIHWIGCMEPRVKKKSGNEFVQFVGDDIVEFTRSLKAKRGQSIWMVGGGEALHPLIQARLLDEFIIQIAPAIIGRGIPLFIPGNEDVRLRLLDVRRCGQFVELHYEVQ